LLPTILDRRADPRDDRIEHAIAVRLVVRLVAEAFEHLPRHASPAFEDSARRRRDKVIVAAVDHEGRDREAIKGGGDPSLLGERENAEPCGRGVNVQRIREVVDPDRRVARQLAAAQPVRDADPRRDPADERDQRALPRGDARR